MKNPTTLANTLRDIAAEYQTPLAKRQLEELADAVEQLQGDPDEHDPS